MSSLNQIRQRLLTIHRANTPSSCRHASTNSNPSPKINELTQKASDLANQYGSKLPELSEKIGKRFDGLLGSYSQPVSQNYQFTKEVLKQVYIKENLAPPKLEQIKSSYHEILRNVSSLNFWKQSLESGDWKRLAVYGVEAVGLFSIGEMIGRRHIVGYKLD
ncbi:uncharacterized protein PGTG_11927 [Puccinia graminis f. sp. tritici CRL 75-36-700-3]|uniref:ATP synthase subunit G atp20 n=1 Tax=Puccinia graminis f. sp. tritici (strain CRL 75-36-700-3 / race SCCL) TaxID=418459 RepID=E3KMP6_PUCGT|nr:uncharacterized protein PGTG_11927 [Puccinia graminis f. sp. tritici CRL 75-36-700-3]EFP85571.2 hypothetical protein PGTG_11927 [Puccinia graminis f. sp. tritici CRL 75-36-700-3]